MRKKEKTIIIDLSPKIKFTSRLYISLGTFLLSFTVALFQFIIALNDNSWIVTPACWVILLNFVYSLRLQGLFSRKSISEQADILSEENSIEENRLLIRILRKKIKKLEKDKDDGNG
jgi:hypothetical protein